MYIYLQENLVMSFERKSYFVAVRMATTVHPYKVAL